ANQDAGKHVRARLAGAKPGAAFVLRDRTEYARPLLSGMERYAAESGQRRAFLRGSLRREQGHEGGILAACERAAAWYRQHPGPPALDALRFRHLRGR